MNSTLISHMGRNITLPPTIDLSEYHSHSELLSNYPIEEGKYFFQPTSYSKSSISDGLTRPDYYLTPRHFGFRVGYNEDHLSTTIKLLSEIDRIFLPSTFEYMDGDYPISDVVSKTITKVVLWRPLTAILIPHSSEYSVRIILNVEYNRRFDQ